MVQIDIKKIPEADTNVMARGLLATIAAYFEDPENMRRFKEWERKQEEKLHSVELHKE